MWNCLVVFWLSCIECHCFAFCIELCSTPYNGYSDSHCFINRSESNYCDELHLYIVYSNRCSTHNFLYLCIEILSQNEYFHHCFLKLRPIRYSMKTMIPSVSKNDATIATASNYAMCYSVVKVIILLSCVWSKIPQGYTNTRRVISLVDTNWHGVSWQNRSLCWHIYHSLMTDGLSKLFNTGDIFFYPATKSSPPPTDSETGRAGRPWYPQFK